MILSAIFTVVSFVLVLFVLVIVHEWGHFFMARRFGVRVYEFGFGFPPKIAKLFHKNGTDYTANWIPLGGFVRLKGEDGSDAHDADSFASKAAWKRLIILVAGVFMNFVLGYVIFVGLFAHGLDMSRIDAGPRAIVTNERVVVGGVIAGSPAARNGLLPGDVIVGIGNNNGFTAEQIHDFIVAHSNEEISLEYQRGGRLDSFVARPAEIAPGVVGLGVNMFDAAHVRYSFPYVFIKAGHETGEISTLIFKTLGTIVGKLVRHGQLQEGVSGPVGIAVVTGQVARAGWVPLLQLMAMLSINLGILNVLPIPSLDGGRALFVILEKVIRRKLRGEIERYAHVIGFALLMALVLVVTYRDILGLIK